MNNAVAYMNLLLLLDGYDAALLLGVGQLHGPASAERIRLQNLKIQLGSLQFNMRVKPLSLSEVYIFNLIRIDK